MKKLTVLLFCVLCVVCVVSCNNEEKKTFKPETLAQKYYYCFGNYIANSYSSFYEDFDYEAVANGIFDTKNGTFSFSEEDIQSILNEYQSELDSKNNAQANDNLKAAEAFLAENKNKSGVFETSSGLQYSVVKESNGAKPKEDSVVTVHYELADTNGKVIESTLNSGNPASFSLQQVIPGFAEGLMLMNTGSTYKLFIHPNLGYGVNGAGQIGPNQVLVFTVTLLSFK